MITFRNYILQNFGIEMPSGDIHGNWFAENGLPMIVACTCCGSTMMAPSAWIDSDGSCYCSDCAGAEEDYEPEPDVDEARELNPFN